MRVHPDMGYPDFGEEVWGRVLGKYDKTFWCVAKTIPSKDKIALAQLSRQGFRTFCPQLPAAASGGRSHELTTRPLFPGYCFIGVNPDAQRWKSITGTMGVSKLITFGDQPAKMPSGIVERMISMSDSNGCLPCDYDLKSGDTVRIVGGPFDDWLGEVIGMREADRVIVLLDLMSTKLPVTVGRSNVRSVRRISACVQTA